MPPKVRIARIVHLMRTGKWVRGVTAAELADEWSIALKTVENDACEAARILDLLGEPERVREWAMVELRDVVDSVELPKDRVPAIKLVMEAAAIIGGKAKVETPNLVPFSMEKLKEILGPLGYEIVEKGKTNG